MTKFELAYQMYESLLAPERPWDITYVVSVQRSGFCNESVTYSCKSSVRPGNSASSQKVPISHERHQEYPDVEGWWETGVE